MKRVCRSGDKKCHIGRGILRKPMSAFGGRADIEQLLFVRAIRLSKLKFVPGVL